MDWKIKNKIILNNLILKNYEDILNKFQKKNYKNNIKYRILMLKLLTTKTKLLPPILNFWDKKKNIIIINNKTNINDLILKPQKKIIDLIKNIGGKIKYVKSGATGHILKLSIKNTNDSQKNIYYALKFVAYSVDEDYGNYNNISRPENVEILILKLLSVIVINNISPHILLPISTFNIDISEFINIIKHDKNNKKYNKFLENYENKKFHNIMSVLICEWADGGDLLDFLQKNYNNLKLIEWKIIFFQLLFTMSIIHQTFPNFRHNDLKANNILLVINDDCKNLNNNNNKNFIKYTVNNIKFYIPYTKFSLKLWDFDFSSIHDFIKNIKVDSKWTKKYNIESKKNHYYDIHFFFNTLTKIGFLPEILTSNSISPDVSNFIKKIVPSEYSSGKNVSDKGRILLDVEYTTPIKLLLEDPFFNEFKFKL